MSRQFQMLQIMMGTGLGPKVPKATRLSDFERDVLLVNKRPVFIRLAEAADYSLRYSRASNAGDSVQLEAIESEMIQLRDSGRRQLFADAVGSATGFADRLHMFWSDHFSVIPGPTNRHPYHVSYQQECIRGNIGKTFFQMLADVITHPSMCIYLNQNASSGPNSKYAKRNSRAGLNENLGRELIELHTIGVDSPYTQEDVRQSALMLTGLRVVDSMGGRVFDQTWEEPGPKTILGMTFQPSTGNNLNHIYDYLYALSVHPFTARHISYKLACHFTSDVPDENLVSAMAKEWLRTKGNLLMVYRVMLLHPATLKSFNSKVKRPFEYVVSGLRALGVTSDDVLSMSNGTFNNNVYLAVRSMGQDLDYVPGPNGWPEQAAQWASPGHYSTRIMWSHNAPIRILGAPNLPEPSLSASNAFGLTVNPELALAITRAPTQQEATTILLASSDFNRR